MTGVRTPSARPGPGAVVERPRAHVRRDEGGHLTGGEATGLLLVAGFVGGTVNGAAGGGTLVSFPALLAVGLPALQANMTSTVGIWPGYLGGVAGFRREVGAQRRRVGLLAPAALLGGTLGSVLLFTTPKKDFAAVVPYLVLLACVLFAVQPAVAKVVRRRAEQRGEAPGSAVAAHAGTFVGAVYGGYFGAGLGVVLLGVLGLVLPDELVRTNGLRSVLSLLINTVAALIFIVHGDISWADAGLLAVTSLVGGYFGAHVARRLPTVVFRVLVLALGLATAASLLAG
ncbi:MAG TPA: sulfite exporter TauE/SafE family protein [Acidimicrobiales bacterium]|nr:sulfite exporter TauE/SafE family protein [Acidimicrobiales bacterium]